MELLLFEDRVETINDALLQQIVVLAEDILHETITRSWFFYEEGMEHHYKTMARGGGWEESDVGWFNSEKINIPDIDLLISTKRIVLCDYYWQNSGNLYYEIFRYFASKENVIFILYSGISTNDAIYSLSEIAKYVPHYCQLLTEVWQRPIEAKYDQSLTNIRSERAIEQLRAILQTAKRAP